MKKKRRPSQILDYLKEKTRYCNLQEGALYRPVWRTRLEEPMDLLQDRLLNDVIREKKLKIVR